MIQALITHASSDPGDAMFRIKQWFEQPNSPTASTSPLRSEFESVNAKLAPTIAVSEEWSELLNRPLKFFGPTAYEYYPLLLPSDRLLQRTDSFVANFTRLFHRTTSEPISASISIMLLSTLMRQIAQQTADDWSRGRIHTGIARQLTAARASYVKHEDDQRLAETILELAISNSTGLFGTHS